MLSQAQLLGLMEQPEGNRLERTTSLREDKLGPAICALANDFSNTKQPGYILLGIDDEGEPAGKQFTDEDLQKIGNLRYNGNVLPQPSMVVSDVFHLPKGDVVVIQVLPSLYPPVRFDGRCYIRLGPRMAKASVDEEKMLVERRSSYAKTFDLLPMPGSSLVDIALPLFQSYYLPKAIDPETLAANGRSVEEQLASLRFYDAAMQLPTVAGLLVFGQNPLYFLPGAYIQFVRFVGTDKASDVQFEKVFSGSFVTMLTALDDFLRYIISKEKPVRIGHTFQEKQVSNYPYWSVRELVMNAILHRNYDSNAPIYIYEFADRLEIINPGTLYGDANTANFPDISDYRNVVLAEAMKVLGFVNRFNYGVRRAQEQLALNGSPAAVFDFSLGTKFKVTIPISPAFL